MRSIIKGKGFIGAAAIAAGTAVLMLLLAGSLLEACAADPTGPFTWGVAIFCLLLCLAVAIGAVRALIQRWRELQGGEEDEAKKY